MQICDVLVAVAVVVAKALYYTISATARILGCVHSPILGADQKKSELWDENGQT